jgi:hypothetical protein
LRTSKAPGPSRWWRDSTKRGIISAVLTAAAGLLLAVGLSAAPAGAAVSGTGHTSAGAVQPQTLSSCPSGTNNSYEYYVWCNGTGPTSYRAIAYCSDGEVVFGVMRWDGDRRQSYASCEIDGQNSTLDTDWGILLCSNDNGSGAYQGYEDRHGDISQYLQAWGSGTIATGGTWACDYDTSGEAEVSPSQPEIAFAAAPAASS